VRYNRGRTSDASERNGAILLKVSAGYSLSTMGALAASLLLGLLASPMADGSGALMCGPVAAKTLVENDQLRIFERGKTESGVVYGCAKPSGRSWKLGPHPQRGWSATLRPPFAINGWWAGGIELRQVGQDTAQQLTTVRNLRTGERRPPCLIGYAGPGRARLRVRIALMSKAGAFIWAGSRAGQERQVAVCVGGHVEVLDQSEEINLGSLQLHRATITWLHGRERRTAVVT
jgi:hypothetical protein